MDSVDARVSTESLSWVQLSAAPTEADSCPDKFPPCQDLKSPQEALCTLPQTQLSATTVLIRYPLAIAPINGDDNTKAFRLANGAGDEKDSTNRRHNGPKDGNLGIHRGVVVVTRGSWVVTGRGPGNLAGLPDDGGS